MSFSALVKDELAGVHVKKEHCYLAELCGVLCVGGVFEKSGSEMWVAVTSESKRVAERVCIVANKLNNEVQMLSKSGQVRDVYVARIMGDVFELSERTGCLPLNPQIIKDITKSDCCKGSFLRGAFLAGGSIADPSKGNHMEIVVASANACEVISSVMKSLAIPAKYTGRRDAFVVYVKEGEGVASMLAAMGAHSGMLEFESSLVIKEVRNKINRENNCMTANIDKTVTAATRQRRDIGIIENKLGLKALSPALAQMANARIEHPEATLAELAEIMGSTRSGINKRLRRLSEIARSLE